VIFVTESEKNRKQKSQEGILFSLHFSHRVKEGLLLLTILLSMFLLLALMTYHHTDPSWSHYVVTQQVRNAAGRFGAWVSDFFLYLFGYLSYLFPFILLYLVWAYYYDRPLIQKEEHSSVVVLLVFSRIIGFILVLTSGTGLLDLYVKSSPTALPFDSGGIFGNIVSLAALKSFNVIGSSLVLITILLIGLTLLLGISWLRMIELVGIAGIFISKRLCGFFYTAFFFRRRKEKSQEIAKGAATIDHNIIEQDEPFLLMALKRLRLKFTVVKNFTIAKWLSKKEKNSIEESPPPLSIVPVVVAPTETGFVEAEGPKASSAKRTERMNQSEWQEKSVLRYSKLKVIPKLELLDPPATQCNERVNTKKLEARSVEVEARLLDFNVTARVTAVHPGPVVTRFELELAAGTKVSKITNLVKDLARSLSVTSVRVVEVIPGKSVIGIELPNENRETVSLQEVLATKQYKNARSPLTLALGKDIAGHPVIVDLAKMPHLLVAGTTGAGKSVCLNAMLLSFLYKSTPEALRLILIDPKMLELSIYDGIPHLLTPVVTDMKDAATALRWCVVEMERRYRLMAAQGVRNIAGYNEKIRMAKQRGAPLLDPFPTPGEVATELQVLPNIVVLADEFADMMVVVGKKVETLIARLAQKARAAGIHLIFATQRPSVDVITGLIKANIPTRIAFQVSSKVDSRTILDQQGAEQLLGQGDMLYLPPGSGMPVRVHGAFVSDDEVHRVVKYIKQRGKPDYLEEVLSETSATNDPSGYTQAVLGTTETDSEQDPFYDEAVEMVIKSRKVSVSSIQRRFKIGYNRAARIVEAMESAGLISSMENNGQREVLVPKRTE